jgi:hypothetical protein
MSRTMVKLASAYLTAGRVQQLKEGALRGGQRHCISRSSMEGIMAPVCVYVQVCVYLSVSVFCTCLNMWVGYFQRQTEKPWLFDRHKKVAIP